MANWHLITMTFPTPGSKHYYGRIDWPCEVDGKTAIYVEGFVDDDHAKQLAIDDRLAPNDHWEVGAMTERFCSKRQMIAAAVWQFFLLAESGDKLLLGSDLVDGRPVLAEIPLGLT